MKNKIGWIAAIFSAAILGIGFFIFAVVWGANDFRIEWNVDTSKELHWEYGESESSVTVEALLKGNLFFKEGKKLVVESKGSVDNKKEGIQEVEYCAEEGVYSSSITVRYEISDKKAPVIQLVSDPDKYTSPSTSYEEEGFRAIDNKDGDLTDKVQREERNGRVYYSVSDSSGNATTVAREIVYKDVVAPVLALIGGEEICTNINEDYLEPGFTAVDDCEGDITDKVIVAGAVDTSRPGKYTIMYTVSDSYGNETTVVREVVVKDIAPPELSMAGESLVYVTKGSTYVDAGCTAMDASDGVVSVQVSGTVDSSKCGIYKIKYSATDSSGNTATITRTEYDYEKQNVSQTVNPGEKIVYLTFDDGPGRYTQKLLDVLDKYNVKVTFFVTNQFSDYQYMIAREKAAGHTVAVHTYSHAYKKIYSGTEAFLEDFQMMNEIIRKQTGEYAWLQRFPGGSSTTYIRKLEPYVTALSNLGVKYCDWNVSSGDANGNIGKAAVVKNVIDGISKHNVSVVLQHDIHSFSVDAVEEIIVWGLANGYTFLPLEPTSPMVHHNR